MKRRLKTVRIGSRGSALALTQARQVLAALRKANPGVSFEIVVIKTAGDEYQSVELFKKNDTGFFTKAIEEKLLAGSVDVAVHSLKDLPTELPAPLMLAAFPRRLDTRDVLISRERFTLKTLPMGASVATGSPRRKRQLRLLRPDLRLYDVRGNLDTRINRVLKKNNFHAVMLANAGLLRLKRYLRYAVPVSASSVLPAVGQAALGLEARASDKDTIKMLKKLNHRPTEIRVRAERALLKKLQGGCRVPVGVNSAFKKGGLFLEAFVFSTSSDAFISGSVSGSANDPEGVGARLARKLLALGAGKLMKEARAS